MYEAHDLFPVYDVHLRSGPIKERARVIDFRHTFRLQCDKILEASNFPIDSKVLELTVDSRSELRLKVAQFYGRIPQEDRAVAS